MIKYIDYRIIPFLSEYHRDGEPIPEGWLELILESDSGSESSVQIPLSKLAEALKPLLKES